MMIPDLTQFKVFCQKANLIPVWREVTVDFDTPVSLFAKLDEGGYAFLLESLEGGEKWGRFSILGLRPFLLFSSSGTAVTTEAQGQRETRTVADPLHALKDIMGRFRPAEVPDLPRFYGGAVGYMGYDMVRFMERLPETLQDTAGFRDMVFMFPELLLVHDNLRQSLKIIACLQVDRPEEAETVYQQGVRTIEDVIQRLRVGLNYQSPSVRQQALTTLTPEIPQHRFEAIVRRAKEYIQAGDVIQVVLSQRFSGRSTVPPFDLYRALRKINPSPYLYFLRLGDEVLIGSSPEILVRLTGQQIDVRPIAGTRPRGQTREEDQAFEADLKRDPKERAEHLMLVDLGRNDVGRVARMGTVRVEDLLTVERYSHVMHLVTGVIGELAPGKDMFDVLRACFPAGTVSGAPKIRAMEIIEELEHARRGPYAGAVGYFGFSGNMDLAITIRTLCQKGDRLYLQAGAGIVADSDPTLEWEETLNKGRALMRAIDLAQEGLL